MDRSPLGVPVAQVELPALQVREPEGRQRRRDQGSRGAGPLRQRERRFKGRQRFVGDTQPEERGAAHHLCFGEQDQVFYRTGVACGPLRRVPAPGKPPVGPVEPREADVEVGQAAPHLLRGPGLSSASRWAERRAVPSSGVPRLKWVRAIAASTLPVASGSFCARRRSEARSRTESASS